MTWLTGRVTIPVYTPRAPQHWSPYRCARWAAPFVWLVWLLRGVRLRLGWAAKGRAVTVDDMLQFHPGKPRKCLCRGEGIITSYRGKERGMQFCAVMLGAFRAQAGFRCVNRKGGPRWLAGYEPERLVRATQEAKHG